MFKKHQQQAEELGAQIIAKAIRSPVYRTSFFLSDELCFRLGRELFDGHDPKWDSRA